MFKRSRSKFGDTPVPETPYQKAAQVWDDRWGAATVSAKNWRMGAFASLGLVALMGCGLIWQSAQATITPYVVEVNEDGGVKAIGPVNGQFQPSDAQIAHQLADFIKNVRSVSIDPIVLRDNWMDAYNYATDEAAITLNSYALENDPFADVGQRSVKVDIKSVVRSSDDSFEIRWRESLFRKGSLVGAETFTASLNVITVQPKDAETLHRNPLGLYVHGLHWSKDLSSSGVTQ
jgi:type IV secretion system protein VirB5